jgi:hypothetical protein
MNETVVVVEIFLGTCVLSGRHLGESIPISNRVLSTKQIKLVLVLKFTSIRPSDNIPLVATATELHLKANIVLS